MFSKFILNTILLFSVSTVFAQTDGGQKVNTKLIKVTNKVYMLQGKGGNIGLSFGKDGVFMIDDQYADGIEQIQNEIKKVSDQPVRFLVNTHFHGDHTGGNPAMAETGTVIFSQENVRNRLQDVIAKETKKIDEEALPIVTFAEDLTFYFNGEKIYVFHVHNAHTDGDSMVYFTGSNVLHTGDVFFNGKYPYIDTANGGSLKGYIAGLEKALLVINEDTKVIPGHGDMGSYKDLRDTIEMLSILYKRVYNLYLNKKTEEEIIKTTDLTKEYDDKGFGNGFIKTEAFLKMIYKEVAQEAGAGVEDREARNKEAMKKYKEIEKKLKEKEKN